MRKKRLGNKRGMSLVELVVAAVICVVVIGAAGSMFLFTSHSASQGSAGLRNQQNASLAREYLQFDLSTAVGARVGSPSGGRAEVSVFFENGDLVFREKDRTDARVPGIDSLTLTFGQSGDHYRMGYEIVAGTGKEKYALTGGTVMNNLDGLSEDAVAAAVADEYRQGYKLSPGSGDESSWVVVSRQTAG